MGPCSPKPESRAIYSCYNTRVHRPTHRLPSVAAEFVAPAVVERFPYGSLCRRRKKKEIGKLFKFVYSTMHDYLLVCVSFYWDLSTRGLAILATIS